MTNRQKRDQAMKDLARVSTSEPNLTKAVRAATGDTISRVRWCKRAMRNALTYGNATKCSKQWKEGTEPARAKMAADAAAWLKKQDADKIAPPDES